MLLINYLFMFCIVPSFYFPQTFTTFPMNTEASHLDNVLFMILAGYVFHRCSAAAHYLGQTNCIALVTHEIPLSQIIYMVFLGFRLFSWSVFFSLFF